MSSSRGVKYSSNVNKIQNGGRRMLVSLIMRNYVESRIMIGLRGGHLKIYVEAENKRFHEFRGKLITLGQGYLYPVKYQIAKKR